MLKNIKIFSLLTVVIFSINAYAKDHSESKINSQWCSEFNGQTEYRTIYGTYVDCLTERYAVEAEFDFNWKESIGQSLHYAEATKKDAAILFIHRK